MAKLTGLEPAASGVTGRRSNQLSYNSMYHQKKGGVPSCVTGSTSGATGMKGSGGALQGCRGQRQLARLIRRRGTRRVRAFNLSPGEIDPERDRHSPTRLTLRYWCSGMGLNHRRPALQAGALPLSYPSEYLSVGPGSRPDLSGSGLRRPTTTGPPRAVRGSRKDIHVDGRSSGVRTHDLPPPRRTRYQAAPYSENGSFKKMERVVGFEPTTFRLEI